MATKKTRPATVVRGSNARWEMMLDVKRVTAAIGTDALANFYRCFAAADLLAAAMYEAGNALQRLTSNKLGQTLQSHKSWRPLSKMRKEWNTDAFAGTPNLSSVSWCKASSIGERVWVARVVGSERCPAHPGNALEDTTLVVLLAFLRRSEPNVRTLAICVYRSGCVVTSGTPSIANRSGSSRVSSYAVLA